MKNIRKILKGLLVAAIAIIALLGGIIIYALVTDYKPGERLVIEVNEVPALRSDSLVLSLLTWNIGYCGLDKEMDFFYDGGKKVMTPKENSLKNLSTVMSFLKGNDSVDFILLQEVDRHSKRSYKLDQYEAIKAHTSNPADQFAINYQVFFVPVPPSSPMGKVLSGISVSGKYSPASSIRYSFPGKYGFPKQLFMLDRCFLVNRFPLSNGKELILINTHNEAFDPGEIRKAQMEYLKQFIIREYDDGNYIIAGGDWNQCPPEFIPQFERNRINDTQMVIPSDYLAPDWTWIYDSSVPSNRSVDKAYDPATTTTTVIDFFLVSPNVEKISVKGIDLDFEHSDHNPVIAKVMLKP